MEVWPRNSAQGNAKRSALALEMDADVLLIDERAGRQEAEARHIKVAGTLAVLLQAALRGYFDFPEALGQLRLYGFRVSRAVEATMLARYEQGRQSKPQRTESDGSESGMP